MKSGFKELEVRQESSKAISDVNFDERVIARIKYEVLRGDADDA